MQDPALKIDLASAGMVASVAVEAGPPGGGAGGVTGAVAIIGIELTTPACPSKDLIAKSIEEAVGRLPGLQRVEVRFTSRVLGRPNHPSNPRLPGVKNIIAVAAGKGGVGKSTVSTNLAAALSKLGASVGILDADVYGPSIPQMMGPPERAAIVDTGNKIIPALHHGLRVVSIGFFV